MRRKEFDPDAALERAMETFWSRGYDATGVADLVEAMGIARASLYATFGSKAELYLRSVDRYCETRAKPALAVFDQPGELLPRLTGLLRALADAPTTDPDRRGCLVVNAATEVVPHDVAVAARVATHLRFDEDVLTAALERAHAAGEVRTDQSARAQSRFLVATIQGLRVMGKATADPGLLHDVARVAVDALRPVHLDG